MTDRIRTVDMSDPAVVLDCYRKLNVAYKELKSENEKLRAALAPFVDAGHFKVVTNVGTTEEYNQVSISVRENKLRAAAAALKEMGK